MAIDFPDSPSVNDTFTAGGKVYQWDGTVWEIYGPNVSPGTFKIDDVNNRVGIGTATPEYALHVDGDVGFNDAATANFFVSSGTGANFMPSGTTAERPASPTAGMFRFNETTGEPEWYSSDAGTWIQFRSRPELVVSYLVIAGGGGGGGAIRGSGGGAGGYRNSYSSEISGGLSSGETPLTLSYKTSYSVTVGAGGNSGAYSASNGAVAGTNGHDSTFSTITSTGGGGGAASDNPGAGRSAGAGGSGGGGWYGSNSPAGAGTANQGFAGGSGGSGGPYGGGGGGAGQAGRAYNDGSDPQGGGDGLESSITGSAVYRAGGGSASDYTLASNRPAGLGGGGVGTNLTGVTPPVAAANGTSNTGGGGGSSGNGGSGTVILRYAGPAPTVSAGLTYTISNVGSDKVIEFTAGTGTVSW
jgi:hypothetical protein